MDCGHREQSKSGICLTIFFGCLKGGLLVQTYTSPQLTLLKVFTCEPHVFGLAGAGAPHIITVMFEFHAGIIGGGAPDG